MNVLTTIGEAFLFVGKFIVASIVLILWLGVSLIIACIPVAIVLWFFGVI